MGVLEKMDGAKPVDDRFPFISAGGNPAPGARAEHEFALLEFFVYDSANDGQAIGADLLVISSSADPATGRPIHEPGTAVACRWKINAAPAFKGDKGDKQMNDALTFVMKLIGGTEVDAKTALREKLLNGPKGDETNRDQPLRGMRLRCSAEFVAPKPRRDGSGMTKPFTRCTWTHVAGQAPEAIAALRSHMDGIYPLRPRSVAQSPQAYGAPQPQGYGYPPPQAPGYAYPAPPAAPPAGYGYGQPAPVQGPPPGGSLLPPGLIPGR